MKKFLIILSVIFIANLGCKKLDKGDRLCGCSPATQPPLTFVIKGANGTDLLNPATVGYFSNNDIKLYQLEENGAQKQLNFFVRPNFSNGVDKFDFYQIHSAEIMRLAISLTKDFYLKLGDKEPLKINLERVKDDFKVSKLTINGVEKTAETGIITKYMPNVYVIEIP